MKEILELNVVIAPEAREAVRAEIAAIQTELAAAKEKADLDAPTRSLAFIRFTLCHSLPMVNANGAGWTYKTLKNSLATVADQPINLNHQMNDNGPSSAYVTKPDVIVGHMRAADLADSPDDEFVPSVAVPICVDGVTYKRTQPIQRILGMLADGQPVKVSMECEYNAMDYFYDGAVYTAEERPDLAQAVKEGKRELDGKRIARVLGGKDGTVNFHGAALLLDENPADPGAEVKAAIANAADAASHEVGGAQTDLALVSEEVYAARQPLSPNTFNGPEAELTLDNLKKGQANQQKAIIDLQKTLAATLNMSEKVLSAFHRMVRGETADAPLIPDPAAPTRLQGDGAPVIDPPAPLDPNTPYADPGYLDALPRYPLTTQAEVLAAVDHFTTVHNLAPYTDGQIVSIQDAIIKAASRLEVKLPPKFSTASVASTGSQAQPSRTQEEPTTMMTEEEKKAFEAAQAEKAAADQKAKEAEAAKEEALSKAQLMETQFAEMQAQLAEMKRAEAQRQKAERSATRKSQLASEIDLDDDLLTELSETINEAEDAEFAKLKSFLVKTFQKGKASGEKAALEKAGLGGGTQPTQDQIDGSKGEPTPATPAGVHQGPDLGGGVTPSQDQIDGSKGEHTPATPAGVIRDTASTRTPAPARTPLAPVAPAHGGVAPTNDPKQSKFYRM
jgi:chemotaxis protein histidine kinase CheA